MSKHPEMQKALHSKSLILNQEKDTQVQINASSTACDSRRSLLAQLSVSCLTPLNYTELILGVWWGGQYGQTQPGGSSFCLASLSSSAGGTSGILKGEAMADIWAVLIGSSLLPTNEKMKNGRHIKV